MNTTKMIRAIVLMSITLSISSFMSPTPTAVKIREQAVNWSANGKNYKGFVAFDENIKGKRPAIVVVPEWWGVNDYTRSRARQLAALGYIAITADIFGNGMIALNPQEAQELTKPFYADPSLARPAVDAAVRKLLSFPQTDVTNMAAIGYCFGGYIVLNAARQGANLKGVVSFHGGLGGSPADKKLLKAKILVCNGGADKFVSPESIAGFKHSMDSIQADYTFKTYPNATHAFTNPDATKIGKKFNMPIEYNAEGDKASWEDMKTFFAEIFKK